MRRHYPVRLGLFALSFPLWLSHAQAAGFYIQESSVSALGAGFAGDTSSAEDASTVFSNPAGMTELGSAQMQFGMHMLAPKADLDNRGSTFDFNGPGAGGIGPVSGGDGDNPYQITPVPNFYAAAPVNDRLWMGVGVTAPFGLSSDYGRNWFGRFDSTKTKLTTVNVQPSLAYRLNDWVSLGGGLDVQYANATLESAVSNIASEGLSRLHGDDVSAGYNFGVQLRPREGTRIGAQYRSGISHNLEGRISVSGLTSGNFNIPGTAVLSLPDMASIGITQDICPRWRVMGQANWFNWSNFRSITARNAAGGVVSSVPQNYQDTIAFSLGTEYDATDRWTVRAGYQFDPTPTKDQFRTTRTPDGDRNWFTTGATYQWTPATSIDFAAVYIDVGNETIDVTRNSGFATVHANTSGQVGIISAAVNYRF